MAIYDSMKFMFLLYIIGFAILGFFGYGALMYLLMIPLMPIVDNFYKDIRSLVNLTNIYPNASAEESVEHLSNTFSLWSFLEHAGNNNSAFPINFLECSSNSCLMYKLKIRKYSDWGL